MFGVDSNNVTNGPDGGSGSTASRSSATGQPSTDRNALRNMLRDHESKVVKKLSEKFYLD